MMSGRRGMEQPAQRRHEPGSASPDGKKPPQRRRKPHRPPRGRGGEGGGGGITRERREGSREHLAASAGGLAAGCGRRGRAGGTREPGRGGARHRGWEGERGLGCGLALSGGGGGGGHRTGQVVAPRGCPFGYLWRRPAEVVDGEGASGEGWRCLEKGKEGEEKKRRHRSRSESKVGEASAGAVLVRPPRTATV